MRWYLKNCCMCIETFIQSIKPIRAMEMRSKNAAQAITELEHKRTMERMKNHLQIFSQQHSIVNGHYVFLFRVPLPRLPLCFLSMLAYAQFPFLMRVHICSFLLLQTHELIPIALPLVRRVCGVRDLFIKQKPIDSRTNHILYI